MRFVGKSALPVLEKNCDGVLWCQALIHVCVTINNVIRIPWLGFPTFLSCIHHSSPLRLTMQFQTLKSTRSTLQFTKTNQHLKKRKRSKGSEANILLGHWGNAYQLL